MAVARLFTPDIASFYESEYSHRGVSFIKGALIVALEADPNTNNVRATSFVTSVTMCPPAAFTTSGAACTPGPLSLAGVLPLLVPVPGVCRSATGWAALACRLGGGGHWHSPQHVPL